MKQIRHQYTLDVMSKITQPLHLMSLVSLEEVI